MGRVHELERLRTAIAKVASGSGSIVLVSGETGVGKTRLAHEALVAASARGFLTLAGKGNPLTGDLPYGPVVEALARFLEKLDPPHRARLTQDLPALGQLIEGLDLPVPERFGDASLEKTRLFESVLRFLDRSSRGAPLALLLDDLQWFDRSSLELLAYLAKDLPELPILLVGTYRSDEAEETESLDALVHTFRRAQITHEIELTPLGETELGEIITSFLEGTVPPMVVEWVTQQSAGIPLFAEALVGALRDQGGLERVGDRWILVGTLDSSAPPLVRDIVRQRFHRLTEPERQLVEVAAVAGADVPHAVLEEVFGPADLSQHLSRLLATGILVERATSEVAYGFAHPLMAQVAYEDTSPFRRRQLHARFAAAWDQRAPLEFDRLAFHYRGAVPDVDASRALEVSVAAGARALDRYANAEALEHLEAVLRLRSLADFDLTERILVLLGEARYRTGDVSGAVEAWDEAMSITSDAAEPVRVARLHNLAARALAEANYEAADRRVEAGLTVLADSEASDDLLEILYLGVITAHRIGWLDLAEARIRAMAEAVGRVRTDKARALLTVAEATISLDRGDYQGAVAALEERGGALSEGGPQVEMRGRMVMAAVAAAWGDLRVLRETNRRAAELVRRTGVPSGEIRLQLSSFLEGFYGGDWERAREIAEETRLLAETIDHADALLLAGLLEALLSAFRGDLEHAQRQVAEARAGSDLRVRYRPVQDILRDVEALVALEGGDADAALAILGARRFTPGPLPPLGLIVRGEAEARAGKPAEALKTAEVFERYGPVGSFPEAMGRRMRGLAAGALHDSDEAIRHLSHAWSTFDSLGLPFEAARAGIELAEATVRSGRNDPDLGDRLVSWHQVTSQLGASRYVGRARRLLHAVGGALPSEPTVGELTPRQLEVADLVAEGLTNAEIGEQLFISVRTVHSHLDHIYTRLGLNSRAALAAWVTERRLRASP